VKVGDLIREKSRIDDAILSLGMILRVCKERLRNGNPNNCLVHWFDNNRQGWTRERYFEVISESRGHNTTNSSV